MIVDIIKPSEGKEKMKQKLVLVQYVDGSIEVRPKETLKDEEEYI